MSELESYQQDMAGIIERLEAASGPDRELDHAIFDATNERAAERDGRQLLPWTHCYTSSIDAALSLVPEGWALDFIRSHALGWICELIEVSGTSTAARTSMSQHAHIQFAIVIAALRARAHKE